MAHKYFFLFLSRNNLKYYCIERVKEKKIRMKKLSILSIETPLWWFRCHRPFEWANEPINLFMLSKWFGKKNLMRMIRNCVSGSQHSQTSKNFECSMCNVQQQINETFYEIHQFTLQKNVRFGFFFFFFLIYNLRFGCDFNINGWRMWTQFHSTYVRGTYFQISFFKSPSTSINFTSLWVFAFY